jgi:murein lipoprotein
VSLVQPGELDHERSKLMALRTKSIAIVGVSALAAFSLSGCATEKYVDEHIAAVNMRIDGVDAHLQQVDQSAQQANAAAAQANAAAEGAAASAQQANQRIDQLTSRVDTLEQHPQLKRPRN